MTYQIFEAETYWECIDSLRRDDTHKSNLIDTLAELRRQPFRNPKLSTHEIGSATNGRKLFSSDVGGRAGDRRIVWQLFNRTIVVLLYGTHKVQDRAKRMRVDFDTERRMVQVYERAVEVAADRPYGEVRSKAGRLFMAWTDRELLAGGFPSPAVEHLRRLDTVDELFALEPELGAGNLERAFDLVAGEPPSREAALAAPLPTDARADRAPDGVAAREEVAEGDETPDGVATGEDDAEAEAPVATAEDFELERLLHDEQAGASFTRVEPEFLADVVGRPIEDWMVFLPADQRGAATRRYQGPARVRGAAGTGKTVVGLHRAAELAVRNRSLAARRREHPGDEPEPVPPVLFTTYIKSLPPVFESLYERLPGTRAGEVEFINVDRLARRICNEAGDNAFVNPSPATWLCWHRSTPRSTASVRACGATASTCSHWRTTTADPTTG